MFFAHSDDLRSWSIVIPAGFSFLGESLFIIWRLLEIFERHTTSLYVLFLDWFQLFDCVRHFQIRASLHHYGVPEPFVAAWMSIYQGNIFYVQDGPHQSSTYYQRRRIRQGCPLSPYLFIVVLSALMHDFYHQFELIFRHRPWTYSAEYPLVDVEYADDTVLMARTQSTLHQLLHLLQHLASQQATLTPTENSLADHSRWWTQQSTSEL